MDGLIGPGLFPKHGVAAGSPFAPYELCLLMVPVIMKVRAAQIGVQLSIHMDDITVAAPVWKSGSCQEDCGSRGNNPRRS